MKKQILDYILVPSGLLLMILYHIWLLNRIIKKPTKTVIGINAINRRIWVQTMMKDTSKNGILAVQTLRNNIMASTLLASTAIMLSSLIAVLMTNTERKTSGFVYGDDSEFGYSVKFFSILICFLLAFLFNVQSIRYYSHSSILVNVPVQRSLNSSSSTNLTADYVGRALNMGSYFWSLGLRAFYFSFPLFLWVFGPIPMFLSCILLVTMLYFLDVTFEFGWAIDCNGVDNNEEEEGRV